MSRTATAIALPDPAGLALAAPVLVAISFCHLLNDMMQSLITATYPMIKLSLGLTFAQLGLVSLVYQLTASLLQPMVGFYTDRRSRPYSLVVGMGFTFLGMLLFSVAPRLGVLLGAAALVGMGSSVFHPEASRVAQLASGGSTVWPSRCSRWGATPGRPWGLCWRLWWCCPGGRAASPGFRRWPCWRSW